MSSRDFKLPDLGEGVHEGQVLRVMVAVGDQVREDQPLMEVETDKAAVVIPSPMAGIVEKVHVSDGQMVHVGDVMVSFQRADQTDSKSRRAGLATSLASIASETSARTAAQDSKTAKPQAAPPARRTPASPAVRKLARELGIDIETVRGSGPGGRVQRADLQTASQHSRSITVAAKAPAARTPSPQPLPGGRGGAIIPPRAVAAKVDYTPLPESMVVEPAGEDASDQYGPIRRAPLTQARKTIAAVMAQSWSTIPHATDFDDADVTELDKLRRGYTSPDDPSRKLTILAFIVRAVVRALHRFPVFNAHLDDQKSEIVYKRYINIAIGVHTERGLVPMVIRNTDHLTIPQISDELHAIGEKARAAAFAVNDTRGGTYTISNAGAMGGSRYSTPIITPGQCAVLALGRTRWMPWVIEGDAPNSNQQRGLAPRLILPLSHSFDHRLADGGDEVQFMQHVVADLQNPARLLL